ncbi:MAG: carbohydrate ABC transporter permease [Eubacteriales bacterium]|nr:carbohydrate ABC transporter permease [Eubacteriales bacterium]
MSKRHKSLTGLERYNRVSQPVNLLFSALMILCALMCVIPLILVISVSLSKDRSLALYGYQFIPHEYSGDAYMALFRSNSEIINAFIVSIVVTVLGTISGLIFNSLLAYTLSRRSYRYRRAITLYITIPMLFGGGMIPFYNVVANFLGLKNNILALILPMAVSTWNIIIIRTFFQSSVPDSIVESAMIDGASQYKIYRSIVLPISKPVLATIGLFLAFAYWNDWYNASLFISNKNLKPLQYLLMEIQNNINYLREASKTASTMGTVKIPPESMSMALVVVIVIPIACIYPFFQRYFISGLTIGAVKG